MKSKKIFTLLLSTLLGTGVITTAVTCGMNVVALGAESGNAAKVLTLDASNKPTEFTEGKATIHPAGYESATFDYDKAEAYADGHVTLNDGGTIKKDKAAGLSSITVEFTGNLKVDSGVEESKLDNSYTLATGVTTNIIGNYFVITSTGVTNINSITVVYSCENETVLIKKECEDMVLKDRAAYIKQTGSNYETDFVDNCPYSDMYKTHAAAYLGYQDTEYKEYACSGNGLVHCFDDYQNKTKATMTWTFNVPSAGTADLIIRAATNDADRGTYTAKAVKVVKACEFSVNGVNVSSTLDQNAELRGRKDSTPAAANRPDHKVGSDTVTTNGRYIFLLWTELNMGKINLQAGENTIVFKAINGTASGQWDCATLAYTPSK